MLYIEKHFNDEVYDIIILQHSRKQNVSLSLSFTMSFYNECSHIYQN